METDRERTKDNETGLNRMPMWKLVVFTFGYLFLATLLFEWGNSQTGVMQYFWKGASVLIVALLILVIVGHFFDATIARYIRRCVDSLEKSLATKQFEESLNRWRLYATIALFLLAISLVAYATWLLVTRAFGSPATLLSVALVSLSWATGATAQMLRLGSKAVPHWRLNFISGSLGALLVMMIAAVL